ncbi:hypothetical protein CK203_107160 [Vitis vinifera]|uniref:Uncharacterized protein n=1 Tax=Vitis vinifera TaxID=29760 RepID=A0A438CSX0_VITVI|nr:hypothetical protein CK203_107160 [Vitis vinifera]
MTPNLRVSFKERQHKCLSKALLVAPLPAKRTRSEVSHEEPVLDAPMTQTPIVHTPGDDINDKDAPISSPSWEETAALLRQVPCLTTPEPPATSINAFFMLTHDNKELHAQLEKTESDLVAAQIAIADASMLLKEAEEGKKTTKVEMCRMKEEKDITEAKCKEAGYERNQLRNEVDELQVASTTQKKELEEL